MPPDRGTRTITTGGNGPHCVRVQDQLEAHIDQELTATETAQVTAHLATCAQCQREHALALQIRESFGQLQRLSCPPRVTEALEAATLGKPDWKQRALRWLSPARHPVLAPALAATLLIAAALLWLKPSLWPDQQKDPGIALGGPQAAPEVAAAEREVKLALAVLGRIGERASFAVQREVVGHPALAPVARTLAPMLPSDHGEAESADQGVSKAMGDRDAS